MLTILVPSVIADQFAVAAPMIETRPEHAEMAFLQHERAILAERENLHHRGDINGMHVMNVKPLAFFERNRQQRFARIEVGQIERIGRGG